MEITQGILWMEINAPGGGVLTLKRLQACPLGPQKPWASLRGIGLLSPSVSQRGTGMLRPHDGRQAPQGAGV